MAKKSVKVESYGPYFETYIKTDRELKEYEQTVPAYREVETPYGRFGVPAKHKMTFKITPDEEKGDLVTPVYEKVASAKPKAPKPVKEETSTKE